MPPKYKKFRLMKQGKGTENTTNIYRKENRVIHRGKGPSSSEAMHCGTEWEQLVVRECLIASCKGPEKIIKITNPATLRKVK